MSTCVPTSCIVVTSCPDFPCCRMQDTKTVSTGLAFIPLNPYPAAPTGVIHISGLWACSGICIWNTKPWDQTAPSEYACVQLGGVSGNLQQSQWGWESLGKEAALEVSPGHGPPSPSPWGKSGLGHGQMGAGIAFILPTTVPWQICFQPLPSTSSPWCTCALVPVILHGIWSCREAKYKGCVFFSLQAFADISPLHFCCVSGLSLLPVLLGVWLPVLEVSFDLV